MDQIANRNWTEIMPVADLEKGTMVGLEVGGQSLALYHLEDDSFHATDNICTHAFALLSEGWLEGDTVECPLHGGCFEVRTGKGVCAPITDNLKTYAVKIRDGVIFAALTE